MSRAFHDLLEMRFAQRHLTPAEHDVAPMVTKGCSFQETATLRQTSDGTLTAQTNAKPPAQIESLFLDDPVEGR